MLLTLFVDALGAYLVADGLIGSRSMRESFIKAGLFGKDLNKSSERKVYVTLSNATLRSYACLAPVTGILVLKILVPRTEIFSGKIGPPGPISLVKMVRPWKFGPGSANWKDSLWYI